MGNVHDIGAGFWCLSLLGAGFHFCIDLSIGDLDY